jgi:hypothetical protein
LAVNLRWHSLLRICRGGLAAGILWVTPVPQAQEVKAAEATGEESIETELHVFSGPTPCALACAGRIR